MKYLANCFLVFVTASLIYSCAGVTGNIKIYSFDKDSATIENCINNLVQSQIIEKPNRSNMYIDEESIKFFSIIDKTTSDTLVYSYKLKDIKHDRNKSLLVLKNFGKSGSILKLDKDLSSKEKDVCITNFEEVVLPKLNDCIK
jgi:hypothetical protein